MKPQLISDTFEQLGQIAGATAQQAKKLPQEILADAVKSLKPAPKEQSSPKPGQRQMTQEEMAKRIKEAERKRSLLHYRELQGEIRKLERERQQQKLEEARVEEQAKAQKVIEEKKKPKPFQWARDRAKQAVEKFRGVSG